MNAFISLPFPVPCLIWTLIPLPRQWSVQRGLHSRTSSGPYRRKVRRQRLPRRLHARAHSKELTSRGEEEIERYGGDDPRDPPLKSPGVVSVAVPALPTEDPNRVTWDGPDDPTNPQNWSRGYKWFLTLVCIIMTVNVYVTLCYRIRAPTGF